MYIPIVLPERKRIFFGSPDSVKFYVNRFFYNLKVTNLREIQFMVKLNNRLSHFMQFLRFIKKILYSFKKSGKLKIATCI